MIDALEKWHDFYVLVGTAGATLLALLFVAVSLGAGFLSARQQAGTRTFMSPVVIHFTSVFFVSAISLMPGHRPEFLAAWICAVALIGAAVSAYITATVIRSGMTDYVQDYFAYGMLPALAYLGLLAAAALIFRRSDWGLDVMAGALLLLAIVNIRNAWDLTLAMVRHQTDGDSKRPSN